MRASSNVWGHDQEIRQGYRLEPYQGHVLVPVRLPGKKPSTDQPEMQPVRLQGVHARARTCVPADEGRLTAG